MGISEAVRILSDGARHFNEFEPPAGRPTITHLLNRFVAGPNRNVRDGESRIIARAIHTTITIRFGWTSNCSANSFSVLSPRIAANLQVRAVHHLSVPDEVVIGDKVSASN